MIAFQFVCYWACPNPPRNTDAQCSVDHPVYQASVAVHVLALIRSAFGDLVPMTFMEFTSVTKCDITFRQAPKEAVMSRSDL